MIFKRILTSSTFFKENKLFSVNVIQLRIKIIKSKQINIFKCGSWASAHTGSSKTL